MMDVDDESKSSDNLSSQLPPFSDVSALNSSVYELSLNKVSSSPHISFERVNTSIAVPSKAVFYPMFVKDKRSSLPNINITETETHPDPDLLTSVGSDSDSNQDELVTPLSSLESLIVTPNPKRKRVYSSPSSSTIQNVQTNPLSRLVLTPSRKLIM